MMIWNFPLSSSCAALAAALLTVPGGAAAAAAAAPPMATSSSLIAGWGASTDPGPRAVKDVAGGRVLTGDPPSPDDAVDQKVQVDEIYEQIMAQKNATIPIKCKVAMIYTWVSAMQNFRTDPLVFCDIAVPVGLNVTAQIHDGTCDEFTDPALSPYFTGGLASPVLIPEVTEEEKLTGTFMHRYCIGLDFMYDSDRNGQVKSLVSRRHAFLVEYTYRTEKRTDEETGEERVVEELTSVALEDENTRAEEQKRDLAVGMGALAGSLVTLVLVAILVGKKRKKTARRLMEERESERESYLGKDDTSSSGSNIEITPMMGQMEIEKGQEEEEIV